jgi:hypothetical protein
MGTGNPRSGSGGKGEGSHARGRGSHKVHVMSDAHYGQTVARAINRYMLWFSIVTAVIAATLFSFDRVAMGAAVLVNPFLVGALGLYIRRMVGKRTAKGPRPGGISIQALISGMPGVVFIFVGVLIGGFIGFFFVAVGTFYVGIAGLLIAMARAIPSSFS